MSDEEPAIDAESLADMAESEPGAGAAPNAGGLPGETVSEPPEESGDSLGSLVEMLMSTEPDLSPRDARGVFDTGVSAADHFEVGVAKLTESSGTPAIAHLLMASVLSLNVFEGAGETGGESDDSEQEWSGLE